LQSDQDRQRVMDGLKQMASANDQFDLADVEQMVSDIKPRVFLMRNVHNPTGALLVHTRWTMSYLAGPMTRQQINYLMGQQKQQLLMTLQQQQYGQQPYPMHPQNVQQSYGNYAPPSWGNTGAMPPAPPNFGGGMTPPPPPGFGGMTPPPPPGFGQTGGYPPAPPMGGFAAQSAIPVPPMSGGTGSMPPVASGDTMATQAIRLPGGMLQNKPPVPSAIREFFLPATLAAPQAIARHEQETGQRVGGATGSLQLAYKPVLLAQVAVRYQNKTAQVYTTREYAFHIPDLQTQGLIHWEQYQAPVVSSRQIATSPFGQAVYQELPLGLTTEKRMLALQKELVDFVANTARIIIPFHALFKLYGDPDKPMQEFQGQVYQIAREKRDTELDKMSEKYGTLMDKLEEKMTKKERELSAEKVELRDRKREELFTTGEAVWSLFKGRPNYTLSRVSKASLYKRQAEEDLKESREVIGEAQRQIEDLQIEFQRKLQEINDRWAAVANQVEEFTIAPFKKDIHIELYGIGWQPFYYMNTGGAPLLVNAFA
jgi:hypothetical protein